MIIVSILIMILILTVLVVVHEWGHYIAARIFGIKVNEFSIFMGPKIFSRVGKKTGTVFSIRCLPLGGFCALEGEEKTQDTEDSFCNKPWWQRVIVLLAGVFMNFVLALVIITILFMINGYSTRTVGTVRDYLPISSIGLEAGDRIVSFNGYSIFNSSDFTLVNYAVNLDNSDLTIKKASGEKEKYRIERDVNINKKDNTGEALFKIFSVNDGNSTLISTYTSEWKTDNLVIKIKGTDNSCDEYVFGKNDKSSYYSKLLKYDSNGDLITETVPYDNDQVLSIMYNYSPYKFGFSFEHVENPNILQAIGNGVIYNASLVKSVFNSLKWLITGTLGLDAMSGPIGITTLVDDVVTAKAPVSARFMTILEMCALISANLAAFNVLPIPGLDGGKLVFIILELIRRGKKVPPEKEAVVSLIFLALLVVFSIIIAGNDIIKIVKGS